MEQNEVTVMDWTIPANADEAAAFLRWTKIAYSGGLHPEDSGATIGNLTGGEFVRLFNDEEAAHYDAIMAAVWANLDDPFAILTEDDPATCWVCDKEITEADDEAGTVFLDGGNGPGVEVCSDACGEAFYSED
jgi:hypothetical protein